MIRNGEAISFWFFMGCCASAPAEGVVSSRRPTNRPRRRQNSRRPLKILSLSAISRQMLSGKVASPQTAEFDLAWCSQSQPASGPHICSLTRANRSRK